MWDEEPEDLFTLLGEAVLIILKMFALFFATLIVIAIIAGWEFRWIH